MNGPTIPKLGALASTANYGADTFTGAFYYSYPIAVPPGTNGLAPSIALSYNSQGADASSIVGTGWMMTESYVQRDINGTATNATDDKYFLVLDGRRYELVYNATADRWHTKIESFFLIKNQSGASNTYGRYFTVRTTDGTLYQFGYNADSELNSTLYPYAVRWYLDQVTDTYQNTIFYDYSENPYASEGDVGAVYLTTIRYNDDLARRVEFTYANRPDRRISFRNGHKESYARRLDTILVKVNYSTTHSLVRSYQIAYANFGAAQPISSITVKGNDSSSTLPSTSFEYYNNTGWTTQNDAWNLSQAYAFENASGKDTGVRFVDLNGDGLMDLIQRSMTASAVLINNGSGWDVSTGVWNLSTDFSFVTAAGLDNAVRLVDLNGDGKTDIIKRWQCAPSYCVMALLNNGTGWVNTTEFQLAEGYAFSLIDSSPSGTELTDVNADGLVDVIKACAGACSMGAVNNGTNWIGDYDWSPPIDMPIAGAYLDWGTRVADINGDGLPDLLKRMDCSDATCNGTALNNGSGWTPDNGWLVPQEYAFINTTHGDNGVRIVDVNGDGLPDLVKRQACTASSCSGVLLNNGTGWKNDTGLWNVSVDLAFVDGPSNKGVRLTDVNGDGLPDLVKRDDCSFANCSGNWRDGGFRNYMLYKIRYPFGGTITIDYSPSTLPEFNNTGSDGIQDLPVAIAVVRSIQTHNGFTDTREVIGQNDYTYRGGMYKFDRTSSEFRGFGESREQNPSGDNIIHKYHQTDALQGREFSTIEYNRSTVALRNTTRTYATSSQGAGTVVTMIGERIDEVDGQTAPRAHIVNYTYDIYGNVLFKNDFGDPTVTGDESYARIVYDYNSGSWIVNTVASTVSLDSDNSTVLRRTNYTNNAQGDPTGVRAYLSSGDSTTNYTYDAYGDVIAVRDARGYVTNYTFDTQTRTFVLQTLNALAQTSQATYDIGTGNVRTSTDANGYVTTNTYDVFGRPNKTIEPYDTEASPTSQYLYDLNGVTPEAVEIRRKIDSTKNVTQKYYFDGRQKLVQVKASAEDGLYATQDYVYDRENRLNATGNPYYASSSSYSDKNASNYYTRYTYDGADRVTRLTRTDNSHIDITYNRNTTTRYDELGNRKDVVRDIRGNIIRVVEYNGSQVYTTRYTYDGADQLLVINDSSGNVIRFAYDTLGRKTGMVDPDMGTWNYTYDASGNLIRQTDGRGTITELTYDGLNRLTRQNSTDETTSYTYDSPVKGTLSRVNSTETNLSYAHDQRLRVTQENLTTGGVTASTSYQYDSMNHAVNKTLPNGQSILTAYNVQGLLENMTGIVTDIDYNALGNPSGRSFSNGLNTSLTYYADTLRLQQIRTGAVQNITYTYDDVGNIESIADGVDLTVENMTYDDLYRLERATKSYWNGTAIFAFNYSIDALNRIRQIAGLVETIVFTYAGSTVHAPSVVNTTDGPAGLSISMTSGDMGVAKGQFFNVSASVCCSGAACGNVTVSMDPEPTEDVGEPAEGTEAVVADEPIVETPPADMLTGEVVTETFVDEETMPSEEVVPPEETTEPSVDAVVPVETIEETSEEDVVVPEAVEAEQEEEIVPAVSKETPSEAFVGEDLEIPRPRESAVLDPDGEYSFARERHCSGEMCTTTYSSMPRFGFENGRWKPLEDLRSFAGTVPIDCAIERDGHHNVECVDYNAHYRLLDVSVDSDDLVSVPVRVLSISETGEEVEVSREEIEVGRTPTRVLVAAGITDTVHVGEESTVVSYVPTGAASFSGWWEAANASLALYSWSSCDANAYSGSNEIAISDGNSSTSIYGSGGGTGTDYTYCHRLKWEIDESPGDITNITSWAYWTGDLSGGSVSITKAFYLGNVTGSSWRKLHSQNTGGSVNHSGNVTSSITDFVENSGGSYYVYTLLHYNASKSGSTYAYSNFYDTQLIITSTTGGGGSGGNSSKGGLISTSVGATPFYTTSANPQTVNLSANQCAVLTWAVNATGNLSSSYTFFAFANQTSNMSNSAISDTINVSIFSGYPQLVANYTFTSSNEGFTLNSGWVWDSTNGWITYNGSDFGSNMFSANASLRSYTNGYNITLVFTTANITNTKFYFASGGSSTSGDKYHFERFNETAQRFKHDSVGFSATDNYATNTQHTILISVNVTGNTTKACRVGGSCSSSEGIGSSSFGDFIAVAPGTMNGKNRLNITTIEVWRMG